MGTIINKQPNPNQAWSVDEFISWQKQQQEEAEKAGRQKFKNKPKKVDGIKFRSTKEANYYIECKRRVLAGELIRFERQKRYKFIINGVLVTWYTCDFVEYPRSGGYVVIDVKSPATRLLNDYIIRKKLMKAIYGIEVVEK